MRKLIYLYVVIVFLIGYLFIGLTSIQAQTVTPTETFTPAPSDAPTSTPTVQPAPTLTPVPTDTPVPDVTDTPTPLPQATTTPSPKPASKYVQPTLPKPTSTPIPAPTVIPEETPATASSQTSQSLGLSRGLLTLILITSGGSLIGIALYLQRKELKRKNRKPLFIPQH